MNYIKWKEQDSRYINGLVICELPPITKPQMRVAETVVDGVDGSVIEELGYATYDKTLTIGLTQKANIDQIIKFFSGTGEVVFSNEPDKFYKATIIGQIDYARLVRFRTATVVFRVQPFKYEYEEQAKSISTKTITGKTITLTNSEVVSISIEGTTGKTAEIQRTGKNLFSGFVKGQKIDPAKGTVGADVEGATSDFIRVDYNANAYYYLSGLSPLLRTFVSTYNENKEFLGRSGANLVSVLSLNKASLEVAKTQATGDIAYLRVTTYEDNATDKVDIVDTLNVQLEVGTEATDFEQYNGHTELIELTSNQTIVENNQLQKLLLQSGTNIISSNANMVVTYANDTLAVDNIGNHSARPIFEIEGWGDVTISINGNEMFRYTFPDGEDTVVIDSQKQDAYFGVVLKNRNMSGEFPIFEVGENKITWNGIVTSLKITSKSRWL